MEVYSRAQQTTSIIGVQNIPGHAEKELSQGLLAFSIVLRPSEINVRVLM
jgi:hypothetical protein